MSSVGADRVPRIAVVHEWLATYAGSERVVEQILNIYPDADLFALVDFLPPAERGFIRGKPVTTTLIQRLPFARRHFRSYLPLFPFAVEQLDLRGYDLVISSSHAVAKGAITGPEQLHICYCHSPVRYAWDLKEEYLAERGLARGPASWPVRWGLHRLRLWDIISARGVDRYVANSRFIAGRIRKYYGLEATVIHPPVDVDTFTPGAEREDFYLAVSRAVPYKQMPMIAEAFRRRPERRLVIISDGPEQDKIKAIAAGTSNIAVLGHQPTDVVRDHMRRARAFVFAAKEDFGIVPVEAQACGTPVIAFGAGGAVDTIRGLGRSGEPTGVLFAAQTAEALNDAVDRFEGSGPAIAADACRRNALRFAPDRFREQFRAFVETALNEHRRRLDDDQTMP